MVTMRLSQQAGPATACDMSNHILLLFLLLNPLPELASCLPMNDVSAHICLNW